MKLEEGTSENYHMMMSNDGKIKLGKRKRAEEAEEKKKRRKKEKNHGLIFLEKIYTLQVLNEDQFNRSCWMLDNLITGHGSINCAFMGQGKTRTTMCALFAFYLHEHFENVANESPLMDDYDNMIDVVDCHAWWKPVLVIVPNLQLVDSWIDETMATIEVFIEKENCLYSEVIGNLLYSNDTGDNWYTILRYGTFDTTLCDNVSEFVFITSKTFADHLGKKNIFGNNEQTTNKSDNVIVLENLLQNNQTKRVVKYGGCVKEKRKLFLLFLAKNDWTIVVDEFHTATNSGTHSNYYRALMNLTGLRDYNRVVLLSGTPVMNVISELIRAFLVIGVNLKEHAKNYTLEEDLCAFFSMDFRKEKSLGYMTNMNIHKLLQKHLKFDQKFPKPFLKIQTKYVNLHTFQMDGEMKFIKELETVGEDEEYHYYFKLEKNTLFYFDSETRKLRGKLNILEYDDCVDGGDCCFYLMRGNNGVEKMKKFETKTHKEKNRWIGHLNNRIEKRIDGKSFKFNQSGRVWRLDGNSTESKQYYGLMKISKILENQQDDSNNNNLGSTMMMIFRRFLSQVYSKIEAISSMVEKDDEILIENDEEHVASRFVIFTEFVQSAQNLFDHFSNPDNNPLGRKVLWMKANLSNTERWELMEDYKNNENCIFICPILIGGMGLNGLHVGKDTIVIFVSSWWNINRGTQAFTRCWRNDYSLEDLEMNNERTVNVIMLISTMNPNMNDDNSPLIESENCQLLHPDFRHLFDEKDESFKYPEWRPRSHFESNNNGEYVICKPLYSSYKWMTKSGDDSDKILYFKEKGRIYSTTMDEYVLDKANMKLLSTLGIMEKICTPVIVIDDDDDDEFLKNIIIID